MMMTFVSVFQTTKNRNRIFDTWFINHHTLETTLERFIFFKILLIFIQGGSTDGSQFTTSQSRLQDIRRIHGTFTATACTHQRMYLIDEQNNSTITIRYLFNDGFQTFFKLTFKFCTSNELPHIECINDFVFQVLGNIAIDDTMR